jgi:hypothetical protein
LAVQAVSSEPVSRGHIPCSLGKNREFQRKPGFWSDGRCEKTRQPSVLEVEFPIPVTGNFFRPNREYQRKIRDRTTTATNLIGRLARFWPFTLKADVLSGCRHVRRWSKADKSYVNAASPLHPLEQTNLKRVSSSAWGPGPDNARAIMPESRDARPRVKLPRSS